MRPSLFGILLGVLSVTSAAHAVTSDQWLSLSDDLGSVSVQHTLVSDREAFDVALPADAEVIALHVPPSGDQPSTPHTLDSPVIRIEPGTTTLRYRSRTMITVRKSAQGDFILAIPSPAPGVPFAEQPGDALWTHLVVPTGFEAIRYNSVEPSVGEWRQQGSWLSFRHHGPLTTTLAVALRTVEPASLLYDCSPLHDDYPACAGDRDGDALPDERDVCLDVANERATWHGCEPAATIRLPGVDFEPGDAYLDIAARDTLDRLAAALLQVPRVAIELTAADRAATQPESARTLARQRAEGARQYLLMRGVAPGRITVLASNPPANEDNASIAGELYMSEVK